MVNIFNFNIVICYISNIYQEDITMKVNYNEFVKIENDIKRSKIYIEFYEDLIRKNREQLDEHKLALFEQKEKLINLLEKGDKQ